MRYGGEKRQTTTSATFQQIVPLHPNDVRPAAVRASDDLAERKASGNWCRELKGIWAWTSRSVVDFSIIASDRIGGDRKPVPAGRYGRLV